MNSGLTIRPISGPDEIELFNRLPYVLDDELADDLAAGRRRREWMWVALRGDRLVARAAWWGRGGDAVPRYFDVFDFEAGRADDGAQLLSAALAAVVPAEAKPPEYGRFVPPDWRDTPASRSAVEERMALLEGAGARLFVERLRLEWLPGTPIREPSGRLAFRPVRDREEVIELMTLVLDGTLDAHSREAMNRLSLVEAATEHYEEELALYRSPREWWRVATLPDGEPVGFVTPARNDYNPIIGYLAVLPAHRGHGYIDDILAEGTRILAAQGVPRIRAATDLGNVPMARAFERAGYVNFERAINMVWDGKLGE
ncbi:GNAT family N-acetyltransferase [Phytohabitans rumicis]|uniref:N-acetyltransferase n=1 Tax=Phytohabitans rumicis TaxID=1076125 RepID=A0A6V8L2Z8_9ACTN|nr:GNAT family N-acetyltransferase [Phytohabitans rumicis]GFJ89151.1 N-acetyltransferase [Phytohabitans rumicis]